MLSEFAAAARRPHAVPLQAVFADPREGLGLHRLHPQEEQLLLLGEDVLGAVSQSAALSPHFEINIISMMMTVFSVFRD